MRKDIKKAISDLKDSINYILDFFLRSFDEDSDLELARVMAEEMADKWGRG